MLAGAAALALTGTGGRPARGDLPARPFRLGVTRWPPDLTARAETRVERFLRRDCDMSAPMILGGVPWSEAAAGTAFSPALRAELDWRPPAGHKLLLSLSALDMARRDLAPWYGPADNLPLPDGFAGRAFDDPVVIAAYRDFALRAAAAMRPDWLVIGVEVNLLLHQRPDAWPAYVRLHRAVYRALKARHPGLQVCFTIEALHYLGLSGGADAGRQKQAMLALLEHSDLVAFSLYPHMSWAVPRPPGAAFYGFMDALGQAAGKPVAIAESGMTSRRVLVGGMPLFGTPEAQRSHVEQMLAAAQSGQFRFVVNFASHDFGPLTDRLQGRIKQLAKIWTYTGLLTSDGGQKPAIGLWRAALERPLRP